MFIAVTSQQAEALHEMMQAAARNQEAVRE